MKRFAQVFTVSSCPEAKSGPGHVLPLFQECFFLFLLLGLGRGVTAFLLLSKTLTYFLKHLCRYPSTAH